MMASPLPRSERPHLTVIRGGAPSEADAHTACPPPAPVARAPSFWQVQGMAGRIALIAAVLIVGPPLIVWVCDQIAVWLAGVWGWA